METKKKCTVGQKTQRVLVFFFFFFCAEKEDDEKSTASGRTPRPHSLSYATAGLPDTSALALVVRAICTARGDGGLATGSPPPAAAADSASLS